MITIALKHFVYELAIDTVFKGFKKNFRVPLDPWTFKVGDKFSLVKTINENGLYEFKDCTITAIDDCHNIHMTSRIFYRTLIDSPTDIVYDEKLVCGVYSPVEYTK